MELIMKTTINDALNDYHEQINNYIAEFVKTIGGCKIDDLTFVIGNIPDDLKSKVIQEFIFTCRVGNDVTVIDRTFLIWKKDLP